MSDTTTDQTSEEPDVVQAEVRCASCSYFTTEPVLVAGRPSENPRTGQPLFTTIRREAMQGQVVEMNQAEFDRLSDLEAVQEPGSAPLPGSPGFRPYTTPFGVPMADAETGEVKAYQGAVMGDPSPAGAGLSDLELRNAAGVSNDQLEEFKAKADGAGDPEENNNPEGFDAYMAEDKSVLVEDAGERELEVSRSDGKEGEPLKEDYARALAENDAEDE